MYSNKEGLALIGYNYIKKVNTVNQKTKIGFLCYSLSWSEMKDLQKPNKKVQYFISAFQHCAFVDQDLSVAGKRYIQFTLKMTRTQVTSYQLEASIWKHFLNQVTDTIQQ